MSIKSPEMKSADFREKIAKALNSENPDELANVIAEYAESISTDLLADMRAYEATKDASILAARGVRQLTSEEKGFYEKMQKMFRTGNVKESFTAGTGTLPVTLINAISEDIKKEFPLLDAIDFDVSGTVTKFLINKQALQFAAWGGFGTSIENELSGSIGVLDVTSNKLYALLPVSKDYADAGVEWIDVYIRAILVESIGAALVKGVTQGTGKNMPIGMNRDCSDEATVVAGVYPEQEAIEVEDLSIETLSAILAELAVDDTGRQRMINELLLVCNVVDYYQKIVPEFSVKDLNGNTVIKPPYPIRIELDPSLDTDTVIMGIAKRYKLRASFGNKSGVIDEDKSYMFGDDMNAYSIKLLANGRPAGSRDFVVLDISGIGAVDDNGGNGEGGEGGEGGGSGSGGEGGDGGAGSGENDPEAHA